MLKIPITKTAPLFIAALVLMSSASMAIEDCGTSVTECRMKQQIEDLQRENKTQQRQITELKEKIHAEKPYYFTGAFATPTEWMADVIFNGNYKRFCEAIGKTYVRAETLQDHYQTNRANGHFYKGWYYVGSRFCDSDTQVWTAGKTSPDYEYAVWKYSGTCGCCINKGNWTRERSAIIWCK